MITFNFVNDKLVDKYYFVVFFSLIVEDYKLELFLTQALLDFAAYHYGSLPSSSYF